MLGVSSSSNRCEQCSRFVTKLGYCRTCAKRIRTKKACQKNPLVLGYGMICERSDTFVIDNAGGGEVVYDDATDGSSLLSDEEFFRLDDDAVADSCGDLGTGSWTPLTMPITASPYSDSSDSIVDAEELSSLCSNTSRDLDMNNHDINLSASIEDDNSIEISVDEGIDWTLIEDVEELTCAVSVGCSGRSNFCLNCKREYLPSIGCSWSVHLRTVSIQDLSAYEKRWITFDRKSHGEEVVLCFECFKILSLGERSSRRNRKIVTIPWKYVWPVYMFKVLTNELLLRDFGSDVLHLIPADLIAYWSHWLMRHYSFYFDEHVFKKYEEGAKVMVNVTEAKTEFKNVLVRNRLGELRVACDRWLVPCILCPWGCSSYLHESGSVPFDAIIYRMFPYVEFAGSHCTSSKRSCCDSCRSDFLQSELDMHLYNPEWTVHPSVEFIRGQGPVILTCDAHDGGTMKKYFHLPKSDSKIPSAYPDVLSHAVISARTIHRTKAHRYSTTYQMNRCTGTYSGIECSYVSDNRAFDFISHLTDINEARSYAGRVDIRGLVGRLQEKNILSRGMAESVAERSTQLFGDERLLTNLSAGATMITLQDAMNLQRMLSEHPVCNIVVDSDHCGDLIPPTATDCYERRTIKRHWPSSLIRIHPNDSYGAKICSLPAMKTKGVDCRLLWLLCEMLINVSSLWGCVSDGIERTSQWHGWVLSFLSERILSQTVHDRQFGGDPFKLPRTDPRTKPAGLARVVHKWVARAGGTVDVDDFDAVCFSLLFNEETRNGSVGVEDMAVFQKSEVFNERITELNRSHEVIIFYKGKSSCRVPPPDVLDCTIAKYELRFIGSSWVVNGAWKWNSKVWCRYGSNAFTGWWVAERSPSKNITRSDNIDEVVWTNVDVLVYVKICSVELDRYRSEYLRYIGGQNKASCKVHEVPLITCIAMNKQDSSFRCSAKKSAVCKCKLAFRCPVDRCGVCICDECFKCIPPEMPMTFESCDDNEDEVDVEEGIDTVFENSDSITESMDDARDDSCESSVVSDDAFDYTNLPTGEQCPGFGLGEFAPEFADVEDECNGFETPTTLEGSSTALIDGGPSVIGTSVLLNKCGTMLVRRNSQLQATRRERSILERIVSRRDVGTVPLVFLEGMLFPSIFWCLASSCDGGILGSMPTSFFCQNATRKRFNVASLADHAKTRLKSVSSSVSTDPRYLTFIFDGIANGATEGCDTRVVLSRGFEESMGPAGMRIRNKGDSLYSDSIDNRQCVHDLCGSERESESDLFITLTCNQRQHFGIRRIKCYVDDGGALYNYKKRMSEMFPFEKPLSVKSENEVQRALSEASMNLTVRNWMEVRKFLIRYILESDELPCGSKVRKIFVRDEYQGDAGNLAHLHLIVSLEKKYSSKEGRDAIEQVIKGFVDDIVGADEVNGYISEGILDSWSDYEDMKEEARKYLAHHCSERCMRRTGPGDSDMKCRVPDARLVSTDITKFTEQVIDVEHSAEAREVMEKIGLCKPSGETGGVFVPLRDYLEAKRIHAPVRYGEGNISPVIGRLFAATRSTMNVQICTSHGTSRYVVKYIVKVDENNYIVIRAKQKEEAVPMKADKVFVCNTKITSSAINEKKRMEKSRHKKHARGRAIACTEMMQLILGFPQVHTNMEFIRIPTIPLGERPGIERQSPADVFSKEFTDASKDMFTTMVPTVSYRIDAFRSSRQKYRRHTLSQMSMLSDQLDCPVSLDRVFIFGIRPPELLFVDKMEWYYKVFEREKVKSVEGGLLQGLLVNSLCASCFVDGLGYKISIRASGISLLKTIVATNPNRFMDPHGYGLVKNLLEKAIRYYEMDETLMSKGTLKEWTMLKHNLLSSSNPATLPPIIVYSNVKPYNAPKFVIHLLLSMGHFTTERDLWTQPSMQKAFKNASLVDSVENITENDCNNILTEWIDDQLRYYPIGSHKMDEYIVSANNIIRMVLLDNNVPINEIPPVMYTSLVEHVDDKIKKHIRDCKIMLVETTMKNMLPYFAEHVFPSSAELIEASKSNPVHWDHVLPKTECQSSESYKEQLVVQNTAIKHINTYLLPSTKAAKNLLIAGPPGVGKTYCMLHSILYSLCKGLTVMTTAMLADRAFMLGGRHLHKLFKLHVKDHDTPHRLAELAVISLQKKPELFVFLRRLDILFVDECGQISAELLSTLDIVMRKVRDSHLFMGGIMLIGTIDQVQLRPINGLPFLLSPYVLTTFSLVKLNEYVRCASCFALQEINELARKFAQTADEWQRIEQRLRHLISRHCTFVASWDDDVITDNVIRIFPRREDTTKAIASFLRMKRNNASLENQPFYTVHAKDSMVAMESHSEWRQATKPVVSYLNSKVKEPETLHFYRNALYQFTYNSPGKFNATQLGILPCIPTKEQIDSFSDIPVLVAPPGTKSIDWSSIPTEATPGWRLTTVGTAPSNAVNLWKHGVKAKRTQYALKHHIASTIHSAIGHTVSKIATELGRGKCLWEKAMVVVLVSRVSKASDLIFVGDKDENINAIVTGLKNRNQYDEYMNHIVETMDRNCGSNEPISLDVHPFRQKDIPLPDDTSGVVYLLVSIRDQTSLYIGMTQDINKRLKQHNSGFGSKPTSDSRKRPWGLMAYVCGFCSDRAKMRTFELRWQNSVSYHKPQSPFAAAELANNVIQRFYRDDSLQLVTMNN